MNAARWTLLVGVCAVALLATEPANAVIVYVEDTTNTDNIPGLTGFMTTGALMDGLTVTANFSDGFSETLPWADTGVDSGGVSGSGWSLDLAGDTFGANWNFDFVGLDLGQLVSLILDGSTGFTVFDRTFGAVEGTEGSALGTDLVFTGGFAGDATVTYANQVAIIPDLPVGDLWHLLTVDFGTGGPRVDFSFVQDTDNDSRITEVPEPGTLLMLGSGVAFSWLMRRKRSRVTAKGQIG